MGNLAPANIFPAGTAPWPGRPRQIWTNQLKAPRFAFNGSCHRPVTLPHAAPVREGIRSVTAARNRSPGSKVERTDRRKGRDSPSSFRCSLLTANTVSPGGSLLQHGPGGISRGSIGGLPQAPLLPDPAQSFLTSDYYTPGNPEHRRDFCPDKPDSTTFLLHSAFGAVVFHISSDIGPPSRYATLSS